MATHEEEFTPLQRDVSEQVMQQLIRLPHKKQAMEVLATLSAAFLADVPADVMASWLDHVRTIALDPPK